MEQFVRDKIPNHKWDHIQFVKNRAGNHFTPQKYLGRILMTIFPETRIESNIRAEVALIGDRGAYLELDIYMPDLKLGFEYQVDI